MSPGQLRRKLLAEHPDYCTVSDVARMLGCDKRNIRHHARRLKSMTVEGMTLYHRGTAEQYASVYRRHANEISRLGVTGINVERLQKICEHYYRCQYDAAPSELLALAKRLANIP